MESNDLITLYRPFFDPKAVVIIGASRNAYTFNGVIVKNLLEAQYKGKIYLVHPTADSIMGIPCFTSLQTLISQLKDIEDNSGNHDYSDQVFPELAIILTKHDLLANIDQLGQIGIRYILIEIDIHFKTTEEDRNQIIAGLTDLQAQYNLQLLGPTMIGIIDFKHHFTSSIIPVRSHIVKLDQQEIPGISYLAQSGGLSGASGWWAPSQDPPFSKVIHIGDNLFISYANILEYLFQDPDTKVIIMYIKEITPDLVEIAAKYRNQKAILYKFVGKDPINEPEWQEAGAISVENYIELFEFAKVMLWCPLPINNAVGIIGPSSGAINLVIAEMRKHEIHLAKLDDPQRTAILEKIGGSTCDLGNPVDFWPPSEFIGSQVSRVYSNASNSLLKDPNVGGLFLALEFFNEIEFDFRIFENIKLQFPDKPIIAICIQAEKEGEDRILHIGTELQIPVFINEVERAVGSFACLLQYANQKFKDE